LPKQIKPFPPLERKKILIFLQNFLKINPIQC
jgi:hypothetical protein